MNAPELPGFLAIADEWLRKSRVELLGAETDFDAEYDGCTDQVAYRSQQAMEKASKAAPHR